LKFEKCCQDFVGPDDEPLSVVAMRVSNPDGSPFTIQCRHVAGSPSGFAEIVSDYLPVPHATNCAAFAVQQLQNDLNLANGLSRELRDGDPLYLTGWDA